MRHGPSKKALLDALAQKDAELKRREEQLTSANEEIQRLRKMLAGKERHESMFRQHFSETDADRAPLRQSLEDAQRCPCKEAPDQCSPCEIRSLQEQIDTVQRGSWALTWEIAQIETVKSDIQSLEETVGQIATRGSHHDDNENTDKSRITACLLADPRSIRGELLPAYRNQRLPATKHEALALLRERLESSEQQEQQLRQKLQKAKGSSPAGN